MHATEAQPLSAYTQRKIKFGLPGRLTIADTVANTVANTEAAP